MKLCECGCGEPAPIATQTSRRFGHVKGEPMRFLRGHSARVQVRSAETNALVAAKLRGRKRPHVGPAISAAKRGKPNPAQRGDKNAMWGGDDISVDAIHHWLRRNHPKMNECEQCGVSAPTDYSLIHGRPYSRDRADYRELCRRCHRRYDRAGHPPLEVAA